MKYLDEYNQEEEILLATKQGCFKLTIVFILMLIVAILISAVSCGNVKSKCEAYGNGKTY